MKIIKEWTHNNALYVKIEHPKDEKKIIVIASNMCNRATLLKEAQIITSQL